jgi:hypothetical protein
MTSDPTDPHYEQLRDLECRFPGWQFWAVPHGWPTTTNVVWCARPWPLINGGRPSKLERGNGLVSDAILVIFHNALDIMDVVRGLVAEGWTITAGQLGALSPYLRAHISRFGSYATDELGHRPEAFDPVLKEVDFTTLDLAA